MSYIYDPSTGEAETADLSGSLTSQPCQLGEFQVTKSSRKSVRSDKEDGVWPLH